MDQTLTRWKKIGDGWEKAFPTDRGGEIIVTIGPTEGAIEGLAFTERMSAQSPGQPRPDTRLQDWLELLSAQALIEIVAKRDKYVPGTPETTS